MAVEFDSEQYWHTTLIRLPVISYEHIKSYISSRLQVKESTHSVYIFDPQRSRFTYQRISIQIKKVYCRKATRHIFSALSG